MTARNALNQPLAGLSVSTESLASGSAITGVMTPAQIRERQDYAIQQNITTLRNRVNELGVSEPIVQRQGSTASKCSCRACRTRPK